NGLQSSTDATLGATSVAFSPDSKRVAVGHFDQMVRVWDVPTWRRSASLRGNLDEVWSVSFSPDGRTIASGSKDGAVKIWNSAPQPEDIIELPLADEPIFSSDGSLLVAQNPNRDYVLRASATLAERAILGIRQEKFTVAALSPHRLALGDEHGKVTF